MEVLIPELRKELDSIRSQLTSIVKIVDGLACKLTNLESKDSPVDRNNCKKNEKEAPKVSVKSKSTVKSDNPRSLRPVDATQKLYSNGDATPRSLRGSDPTPRCLRGLDAPLRSLRGLDVSPVPITTDDTPQFGSRRSSRAKVVVEQSKNAERKSPRGHKPQQVHETEKMFDSDSDDDNLANNVQDLCHTISIDSDDEGSPPPVTLTKGNRKRRPPPEKRNAKKRHQSDEEITTVLTVAEVHDMPPMSNGISPEDNFSGMRGRARSSRRAARSSPRAKLVPTPPVVEPKKPRRSTRDKTDESESKPKVTDSPEFTPRARRGATITTKCNLATERSQRRRSSIAAPMDESIVTDEEYSKAKRDREADDEFRKGNKTEMKADVKAEVCRTPRKSRQTKEADKSVELPSRRRGSRKNTIVNEPQPTDEKTELTQSRRKPTADEIPSSGEMRRSRRRGRVDEVSSSDEMTQPHKDAAAKETSPKRITSMNKPSTSNETRTVRKPGPRCKSQNVTNEITLLSGDITEFIALNDIPSSYRPTIKVEQMTPEKISRLTTRTEHKTENSCEIVATDEPSPTKNITSPKKVKMSPVKRTTSRSPTRHRKLSASEVRSEGKDDDDNPEIPVGTSKDNVVLEDPSVTFATDEPTADESITNDPTTDEPTTDEPTTNEPTTSDETSIIPAENSDSTEHAKKNVDEGDATPKLSPENELSSERITASESVNDDSKCPEIENSDTVNEIEKVNKGSTDRNIFDKLPQPLEPLPQTYLDQPPIDSSTKESESEKTDPLQTLLSSLATMEPMDESKIASEELPNLEPLSNSVTLPNNVAELNCANTKVIPTKSSPRVSPRAKTKAECSALDKSDPEPVPMGFTLLESPTNGTT